MRSLTNFRTRAELRHDGETTASFENGLAFIPRVLLVFHKGQQVWDAAEIPKAQIFDSREPYWKIHLELEKETAR